MLTLLKKFSLGGIKILWNKNKNYFFGKFVGKDLLAINIMKVKMVKDGLFILMKLMHQKFQLSGIHGCILLQIKLKKNMI